jgi:hypothetical protein
VSLSSIFKLSLGLIQRCGVFVAVVSNMVQRVLGSNWKCVPFLCLWSSSRRLVCFLVFDDDCFVIVLVMSEIVRELMLFHVFHVFHDLYFL